VAVPDSLFAAALAFHNSVWRYIFALAGRTCCRALGRTAAITSQGRLAGAKRDRAGGHRRIRTGACGPMTSLFFDLARPAGWHPGLAGGDLGRVIAFFARDWHGENVWRRLVAPALAAVLLGVIVVLRCCTTPRCWRAVRSPAAWRCRPVTPPSRWPGWLGLVLKSRRPQVYAPSGWAPTPLLAARSARPGMLHDPCQPDAAAVVIADGTSAGLEPGHRRCLRRLAVSRWLIPDPAARHRIFPATSGSTWSTPWPAGSSAPPRPGRRGPVAIRQRGTSTAARRLRRAARRPHRPWTDRFRVFDQALESATRPGSLTITWRSWPSARPAGTRDRRTLLRAHHRPWTATASPLPGSLRPAHRRLYRPTATTTAAPPRPTGAVMYRWPASPGPVSRPGWPSLAGSPRVPGRDRCQEDR